MDENIFNIVTGPGKEISKYLIADDSVNMITFTGSARVGEIIRNSAGLKKVTLELGSNSALLIDKGADYSSRMKRMIMGAFANAGQVCISIQRIYVQEKDYSKFIDDFISEVKKIKTGNPMDPEVEFGPMINEPQAIRAEQWIQEAIDGGAEVICGGKRKGLFLPPTVLIRVSQDMKVVKDEVFAPVVCIIPYDRFEQGIEMINQSCFGLNTGVIVDDIKRAYYAINNIESGGVIINDVPTFRVDNMPYGGVKKSGIGREGVKFSIEEQTEIKFVCFNLED